MTNNKNQTLRTYTLAMTKVQLLFKAFIRNKFKENNVDLTFEMLQVLINLWEKQGFNQQELANILLKDKASLTPLIDNLSKRGLVQRTEDVNDRRNKLINLTQKGKDFEQQIKPWIEELFSIAGKGLTVQELTTSITLFEKMSGNFSSK